MAEGPRYRSRHQMKKLEKDESLIIYINMCYNIFGDLDEE